MEPKFFRCKNCLYPSTKPDLQFDKNGICGACRFREYEMTIDWEKREQEFYQMIEEIKLGVGTFKSGIGKEDDSTPFFPTYSIDIKFNKL